VSNNPYGDHANGMDVNTHGGAEATGGKTFELGLGRPNYQPPGVSWDAHQQVQTGYDNAEKASKS